MPSPVSRRCGGRENDLLVRRDADLDRLGTTLFEKGVCNEIADQVLEGRYSLAVGGGQPEDTQAKSEAVFTVKGTAALPKVELHRPGQVLGAIVVP